MSAKPRHSETTKRKARELRRAGRTYPEIAAELGAAEGTVYYWLNPRYAASVRAKNAERREANPEATRAERRAYYRRNKAAILRRQTARNRKRARLAAQAREGKETAAIIRGASKPVSEAYSLTRRALQVLDHASPQSSDARGAVNTAFRALHEAEDALLDAGRAAS